MPKTLEHCTRAKQNLAFAESLDLDSTPYLDWVVAAYFYAALHWIDALLFYRDRIDPDDHTIRRDYVKEKSYLRQIRSQYKTLKDRSEDARYRLITMTKIRIQQEIIPLYRIIEKHVLEQLPDEFH